MRVRIIQIYSFIFLHLVPVSVRHCCALLVALDLNQLSRLVPFVLDIGRSATMVAVEVLDILLIVSLFSSRVFIRLVIPILQTVLNLLVFVPLESVLTPRQICRRDLLTSLRRVIEHFVAAELLLLLSHLLFKLLELSSALLLLFCSLVLLFLFGGIYVYLESWV